MRLHYQINKKNPNKARACLYAFNCNLATRNEQIKLYNMLKTADHVAAKHIQVGAGLKKKATLVQGKYKFL